MSGLEHWKRLFTRYCATALVSIRYQYAEGALTEPSSCEVFSAETMLMWRIVVQRWFLNAALIGDSHLNGLPK
jgi:hypothetical protein